MKSASSTVASVSDKIKEVRGVKVLAHRVDNLERSQMRTLVDQLRDKLGSGVVVLGSATDGNVSLIASVTKDLTSRVQAGKVIAPVAQKVGGKGGGRPDMAEAGGKDPAALDSALAEVYNVVETLTRDLRSFVGPHMMEDRIRFIEHKGKQVLLVDISHCNAVDLERIAGYVPKYVTSGAARLGAVARRLHRRGVQSRGSNAIERERRFLIVHI